MPSGNERMHPPTAAPAARRVFLHIGEPKTGTTFLQQVLWRNRDLLATAGVTLPGHHPQDHFRATQDLRGLKKLPNDPAAPWEGEWDVLAGQAREASTAVISHELFAAADTGQIARAVRSLSGAELHVVLTVRDLGTLIPAEWQESVKHRNTMPWLDWVDHLVDIEAGDPDRRRFWFWKVHDTAAIAADWAAVVGAERVHVVTVPPSGAPRDTLWLRFASVLGIDPAGVDLDRARANSALGMPETEFLRRLNERLAAEVPAWFYMARVKEPLAHGVLAARPAGTRLVLPPDRLAWAQAEGMRLVAELRRGGYRILGDLGDLVARPVEGDDRIEASPEQLLDAALDAAAALVRQQFRQAQPAVRPEAQVSTHARLPSRIEQLAASSPRVKRTVRRLSSRYPAVRRLRVMTWRALERARR